MAKYQVWWSGVFLSALATQVGAHDETRTAVDEATKNGEASITVLMPLNVEGRKAQLELPEGSALTTRRQLDERSIESWEDFAQRGEPGVNFNAASKSVNSRGLDQGRIVTRVDGIRVPWLNDGTRGEKGGLDTINFNTLSSIDLVRAGGGASIRFVGRLFEFAHLVSGGSAGRRSAPRGLVKKWL